MGDIIRVELDTDAMTKTSAELIKSLSKSGDLTEYIMLLLDDSFVDEEATEQNETESNSNTMLSLILDIKETILEMSEKGVAVTSSSLNINPSLAPKPAQVVIPTEEYKPPVINKIKGGAPNLGNLSKLKKLKGG